MGATVRELYKYKIEFFMYLAPNISPSNFSLDLEYPIKVNMVSNVC